MRKTIFVAVFVTIALVSYAGGRGEGGGKSLSNTNSSQTNQSSSVVFTGSKPVQQLSFDNRYNFIGENGKTQSCLACATLNIYAATTPGGMSQQTIDSIVQTARQNGSILADGSVANFPLLSFTTALNLGRNTYYDYNYIGTNSVVTLSLSQFMNSSSVAGIVIKSTSDYLFSHFTAGLKINNDLQIIDSLNPTRPSALKYVNVDVRPLSTVPLGRSPR
jgi:hypothetical protein